MENLNIEALHELNESFLKEFPLDTLNEMTLNKYTNLNKSDSFCYWLERKTQMLGGIGGGSSFKFGIYRCKNKPKEGKIRYKYDGKFAWLEHLGNTAEEAFVIVKETVVKAAKYGSKGNLDAIESIVGDAIGSHVKWKIAFLYSTESIVPYYGHERLKVIAEKMGMANANAAKISDIQKFLLNKRGEKDVHEFGKYLDELYKNGEKDLDSPKLKINYWLAGYSFGGNNSQLERFIKDGIWEGGYKDSETAGPKLLEEAKAISVGDIIILKSTAVKGSNHDQPFMRIKAVGKVTSNITIHNLEGGITHFSCSVDYINTEEKDFDGSVYGAYRRTLHRAGSKVQNIIDYVNGLLNKEPDMPQPQQKYKEYIELLQETHNLVLTGAPGTGKTFMAQAIASEMNAVQKFVQFHPSYDYTDFVEGLRPVEREDGQPGFERRDGVFKEFCRDAIRNMIDSEKSVESLSKEKLWQEKLDQFIEESIESEETFKIKSGSEFIISGMKGHNIVIHNQKNEKTTQINVNVDEILELLVKEVPLNIVRDIGKYFERKFGLQADSYAYVITKAVRAMKKKTPEVAANKVERKPFVFIIDEINRGEASKIFGELFYAIDPGYRGKTDHLGQTQYQNMVPETDVFAKGFYVPENVYILATMNDIDRSVESMDFAMHRRFTWHEITPDDTESMLDPLPCADEAKERMHRLNNAIAETDGLGAAYMIGPAYFLKLDKNGGDFEKLWKMNIQPLLKEYLRGFRKTEEILEKFSNAYFGKTKEAATGSSLLEDEN